MRTTAVPTRLVRGVVALVLALAGLALVSSPAHAAGAQLQVFCYDQVAYGGELDCTASNIDDGGNFGPAGTFSFDPDHALPVTWDHSSCAGVSTCTVVGTVAVPPRAAPQTLTYKVQFTPAGSATTTKTTTVSLTLVPTITTLTCADTDLALAGRTHCVVSVVDQLFDGASPTAARMPASVAGPAVSSSDPTDKITYDHPSGDGSTCDAAAVDTTDGAALQCGLTVKLGPVHGLHTLTARYLGDADTDELASTGTAALSDGPRATPVVHLACPASVPARDAWTTCEVTVAPTGAGVAPTGVVTLDQAQGPVPADAASCTLTAGSCSLLYEVFEGTVELPAPPIRATYVGDDNYLPATGSQMVSITPTPTTSSLTCDRTVVPVASSVHCSFTLSSPDGRPVPVGPSDVVTVTTSTGFVVCDQPADLGCGHTDTDTATVVGFTLHAGASAGAQLVAGQYSGDPYALAAGASSSLGLTTTSTSGPVIGVGKTATRTSVHCGSSVAYGHQVSCVVSVTATGTVPRGTVRFGDPSGVRPQFAMRTCTLSARGQCTVELSPSLAPTARLRVTATYQGSSGFQASSGLAAVLVRDVATRVTVHCSHTGVDAGKTVHCVASVRTEFGAAARAPVRTRAEVTVSAAGDRVTYDHGRACRWTVSGHTLTCGFSVRVARTTAVHVYYRGSAKAHDAASKGATTVKALRVR